MQLLTRVVSASSIVLALGCGSNSAATEPPTQTEASEAAPSNEAPADDVEPTEPTTEPPEGEPAPETIPAVVSGVAGERLTAALGAEILRIVELHAEVQVADLRVEQAAGAEDPGFRDEDRIAGYAMTSPLRTLGPEAAAELVQVLLPDESYDFDLARRCANRSMVGARFTLNGEQADLALGMPCGQTFWSQRSAAQPALAGALLSEQAAARAAELLRTTQ